MSLRRLLPFAHRNRLEAVAFVTRLSAASAPAAMRRSK